MPEPGIHVISRTEPRIGWTSSDGILIVALARIGGLVYLAIIACLPRALGVMLVIAGICYLFNSFALILAPALAAILFPRVLLPAFVGELAQCLWLIVKGVDANAWEAARRLRPG